MGDSNDDKSKNMDNLETAVTLEPVDVRESLVQTAVQFLQNPKTRGSSLKLKIMFLKKKGLTEDEIQLAIDRSGTALYEEAKNSVREASRPPTAPSLPPNLGYNFRQQMASTSQPRSPFEIVKDIANTVVALGGLGYLVYWFYKTFIQPWLFGKSTKKKKPDDGDAVTLAEVKRELQQGLARVSRDLDALANQRAAERSRDMQELSGQVATVKGLLLNRSQFPSVPPTSLGSPAKIPSWQLATEKDEEQVGNTAAAHQQQLIDNKMAANELEQKEKEDQEEEEEEEDEEEEDESSKSAAEASDSSLEMINSITNHRD
uniref:Peroxisomal membrane protein PEX14 n=1 Tax=Nilaparvata lugens TaxID=108931 RepID=A0AAU0UGT2_NILLU